MRTIKVGIIGAGAISHEHIAGVSRSEHAEVIAIADMNTERREAFARKYHVPRAYTSAEQLINDPELDAVTIAVPNIFHAPVATMALKAGKHVMLEKPFAPTLIEAIAGTRGARETGKGFMVGSDQPFSPNSKINQGLTGGGKHGKIYHSKTTPTRRP